MQGQSGPTTKGTKTYSGNRKLQIPEYILRLIEQQPHIDDYVIHLSGQAMYKRFSRLCEKAGLPHYRFHDVRHSSTNFDKLLATVDGWLICSRNRGNAPMTKGSGPAPLPLAVPIFGRGDQK